MLTLAQAAAAVPSTPTPASDRPVRAETVRRATPRPHRAPAPDVERPLVRAARIVAYEPHTVVRVLTQVRFTTLIVLPETEDIQDFVCGDRDFWVISGTANVAYIKPAQVGARTNLNLVTSRGAIYSFLLDEVTGAAGREPDLRVQVEPTRDVGSATATRVQPSAQIRALTAERDDARAALARARAEASAAVDATRALAPLQLRFPYRYDAEKAPFFVSAIYHDGTTTYLQLRTNELPALLKSAMGRPPSSRSPSSTACTSCRACSTPATSPLGSGA